MGKPRYGSTLPRLSEPQPLPGRRHGDGPSRGCPCGCALGPDTSEGFDIIRFAGEIGVKLHPWQKWLLIHAMELDKNLSLSRFRIVLVIVARQNGKTLVKMLVTLWRMYQKNVRLCVGIAQDLSQAREVMYEGLVPMIEESEFLSERFDPDNEDVNERVGILHRTLNNEYFRLDSQWVGGRAVSPHGPRYLIKALNRKAGRGLWGVAELNIDELREQSDFASWSAVSKVVMASPGSQIWAMSNAGDRTGVVLNQLRSVGLAAKDPSMFIAEWSAPDGCQLDDLGAQAQANPSAGRSLPWAAIRSSMLSDPPEVFRTECLCQFVDDLNSAIDLSGWEACRDWAGTFEGLQLRTALVAEVSLDGGHVSAIVAAPLPDGRVRIKPVGSWQSTPEARKALPTLAKLLKPKVVGWYPDGPGSVLSATMRKLGAIEIRGGKVSEAHQLFADYISHRRLLHPSDPLDFLSVHVSRTTKVGPAKMWVFDRGSEHTDAAWAAAGAVSLAANLPVRRSGRGRVIVPAKQDGG